MTGAVNKLQRILGLKMPERIMDYVQKGLIPTGENLKDNVRNIHQFFNSYLQIDEELKPIVFVTHMEHHSNQTTWLETIATVEIIKSDENGNVDLPYFRNLLEKYRYKKIRLLPSQVALTSRAFKLPTMRLQRLYTSMMVFALLTMPALLLISISICIPQKMVRT